MSIVLHLTIHDQKCDEAIKWYHEHFGAKLLVKKYAQDNKRIIHSSVKFPNGALFHLCDVKYKMFIFMLCYSDFSNLFVHNNYILIY